MQLEEKDVVSSVANVLSDLCGPGEWMPMEKLHAEVTSILYIFCHRNANLLLSEDYIVCLHFDFVKRWNPSASNGCNDIIFDRGADLEVGFFIT